MNYQQEQELKAKEAIVTNYNLATMVSSFVMNGMNGKSNPSLLELFPDMFQEELQKQKEEEDARYWQLYKEQMLDFAAAHNKKRAKENLGWRYSFGPELYQDMKHINTYDKMEQNRNWIFNGNTTKHNIIFDTKLMYNDMFNDSKTKYWCVRNKVKKNKIISYSGKAPCICCGDSMVMQNDEDFYEHDYGSYNHRFEITGGTLCNYCKNDRRCNSCDETIYGKKISFNDKQ